MIQISHLGKLRARKTKRDVVESEDQAGKIRSLCSSPIPLPTGIFKPHRTVMGKIMIWQWQGQLLCILPPYIHSTFLTAPRFHSEGLCLPYWILSWGDDDEPKQTSSHYVSQQGPKKLHQPILLLVARRRPRDLRLVTQVPPPWNANLGQNESESGNSWCPLLQQGLNWTIPARRPFHGPCFQVRRLPKLLWLLPVSKPDLSSIPWAHNILNWSKFLLPVTKESWQIHQCTILSKVPTDIHPTSETHQLQPEANPSQSCLELFLRW